jgi:alpha-beta hydrolase superfamily lysophospholipase
MYAYKFTHLYPAEEAPTQKVSENIFAKTWRLFSAPRFYKQPQSEKPADYDTVHLATSNGLAIEAWYNKWNNPDSSAKGTVLLFHALSGNKSRILPEAEEFRRWGYNVMLVDARSHGNSAGQTTTIGYRESEEVKLAYDFIKQKGEKTIILWGFSMGAVQIMKAVAEYDLQPAGIIPQMPFLSLQSHIKSRIKSLGFPRQPFSFFITFWIGAERGFNGFGFNMLTYAKKIHCPVLLQYGSKDQLVPQEDAKRIYEAVSSVNKRMVVYDGANHESFLQKDPVLWRNEVSAFLAAISE